MIIIREQSNFSESDITVKIDWDTFCKNLQSTRSRVKHINIYPKTLTNFNIVMEGAIIVEVRGMSVRFTLKGADLASVSIGANDIFGIYEINNPNGGLVFNLALKNGIHCHIA